MRIGGRDTRCYQAVRRKAKKARRLTLKHDIQDSSSSKDSDSSTPMETEVSSDEAYAISTSSDVALNDSEHEPRPSTSAIVEDTVLVSKSKYVSLRAQSDILLQVADTARLSN